MFFVFLKFQIQILLIELANYLTYRARADMWFRAKKNMKVAGIDRSISTPIAKVAKPSRYKPTRFQYVVVLQICTKYPVCCRRD